MEDMQSSSIGRKLHQKVNAILRAERRHSPPDSTRRSRPSRADAAGDKQKELQTPVIAQKLLVQQNSIHKIFIDEKSIQLPDKCEDSIHTVTPVNSLTELEELEYALHRSLSSGAFAGRLRVNKLTLSPRPSLQRVVMHQSGDTTLVLKSNLTQKIQVTSDRKTDLIGLLSNSRLNCGFSAFPLQISTVGYAFPTYDCEINHTSPRVTEILTVSDVATSCTVSEKISSAANVPEIRDEEGKNICRSLMEEECVTRRVSAADQNIKTDTNQLPSVSTKVVENIDEEVLTSVSKEYCETSDFANSFDILVGLLNEIHKITICGSDVASSQMPESELSESCPGERPTEAPPSQSYQETVSNSYVSSNDRLDAFFPEMKSVCAEAVEVKPVCEDKEVSACASPKKVAATTSQQTARDATETSTCTNSPACSNRSITAFTHSESCDIGCNTLIRSGDKITEQMGIETNRTSVKSLVPYYDNMFKVEMKKGAMVSLLPENSVVTGTKRNVAAVCNILVDIAPVQKSKNNVNKCEETNVVNDKKDGNKFCLNVGELDSSLKLKRDILVTFYSMLVLTVFVALAFPEMLRYA